MSGMPRVIHANEKLTSVVDMRIVADVMNPTVSAQYTSYKRTDTVVDKTLVDELITLTNRVVNDHGSYLNMNSGDDDLADMLAKSIAEIQGEGK